MPENIFPSLYSRLSAQALQERVRTKFMQVNKKF